MDTHLKAPVVPTVSVSEVLETEVQKIDATAVVQDERNPSQCAPEHPKAADEDIESEKPSAEDANSQAQATSVNISGSFCPALAVSRFPYKFMQDDLSQDVASEFFDGGKFWKRPWDL